MRQVNRYANFESFGNGIVTLFRMSTGESWGGLMRDFRGATWVSYPYFLSFVVVTQFALVNITVAVLMYDIHNETVDRQRGESSKVSFTTLNDYAVVWADVRLDYETKARLFSSSSSSSEAAAMRIRRRKTLMHERLSFHFDLFRDASKADEEEEEEDEKEQSANNKGMCARLASYLSLESLDLSRNSDLSHPQMRLPVGELPNLLLRLPSPLGLKSFATWITKPELLRIVSVLQIPVSEDGFVFYHLTLRTLIDRVVLHNALNIAMQETFGERNFLDIKAKAVDVPRALDERVAASRVSEELLRLLKLRLPDADRKRLERQSVRLDPENSNAAVKLAKNLLRSAIRRYFDKKRQKGI